MALDGAVRHRPSAGGRSPVQSLSSGDRGWGSPKYRVQAQEIMGRL